MEEIADRYRKLVPPRKRNPSKVHQLFSQKSTRTFDSILYLQHRHNFLFLTALFLRMCNFLASVLNNSTHCFLRFFLKNWIKILEYHFKVQHNYFWIDPFRIRNIFRNIQRSSSMFRWLCHWWWCQKWTGWLVAHFWGHFSDSVDLYTAAYVATFIISQYGSIIHILPDYQYKVSARRSFIEDPLKVLVWCRQRWTEEVAPGSGGVINRSYRTCR